MLIHGMDSDAAVQALWLALYNIQQAWAKIKRSAGWYCTLKSTLCWVSGGASVKYRSLEALEEASGVETWKMVVPQSHQEEVLSFHQG